MRILVIGTAAILIGTLSGCASGPGSATWQKALSPDPRLAQGRSGTLVPNPAPDPKLAQGRSGNLPPTGNSPIGAAPSPSYNPTASPTNSPNPAIGGFTDLAKAPPELRSYLDDLLQINVLTGSASSSSSTFEPNRPITRREYTRWLVAANNRIYAAKPAKQIRLGLESSDPAFSDVAKTDADFAAIQGLAEAGLIPSRLSGDASTTLFRPDAPLTREDLVLWKVPVDTRQALPTATLDAIKQTWGFQDAPKISTTAQRAVLMDYQNGDQANIRRAFGYTTLFQPQRPATRAEAAAVLWQFGFQGDTRSAKDALKPDAPKSEPKPSEMSKPPSSTSSPTSPNPSPNVQFGPAN